jgi:3-hydroxyacyl-CoA dehydrogenase
MRAISLAGAPQMPEPPAKHRRQTAYSRLKRAMISPFTCSRVGIVGAGTMGTGIAMVFANADIPVIVADTSKAARERMHATIKRHYRNLIEKELLSRETAHQRVEAITSSEHINALNNAEIIVEAVFEDPALKREIFARLGVLCSSATILATNTSTLDVDMIAAAAPHPQRCLGLHFFSPAHATKLIEIVRGAHTAEQTLADILSLTQRLGKIGIIVGNCDGFVGNRMLLHYRHEAEQLLEAGATPRQIDTALMHFGFAMGPFAVSDMAGLDIAYRAKSERATRGAAPPFQQSRIPDILVEMGRLGQKSGAGYYRYEPGSRTPHPDPIVAEIIARERDHLGIAPRSIGENEIVTRCLRALINEGIRILHEGIAARAADIDAIWVNGYGFPATLGGPMAYARSLSD